MKNPTITAFLTFCLLFANTTFVFCQKDKWLTYCEKTDFKKTCRYDETIEFCKALAAESQMLTYTTFGKSAQGRDLPLLIVDKQGYSRSRDVVQSNRMVVLIQAAVHAGEVDGKDAGLMLIRDMVIHRTNLRLLDNVTIVFIPVFNVDGHENFSKYNRINQNGPEEMGFRTTSTNLNLNRDYLKMDAPEMKAWHRLFLEWMPDFIIDIHTTNDADYQYVTTYAMEVHGNMSPSITDWQKDVFIKSLERAMDKSGFPIFPYVVFRKWHDPQSGLRSWVATPDLSQGYTALQNRPGLLIENHSHKDYKSRVTATVEMLKHSLTILNREYLDLRLMINEAERYCSSPEFRKAPFPLRFETASDSIIVDFKGFQYEVKKSDLTGGDWFIYNNKKPTNFKVPYFNQQKVAESVKLPVAYVVPPEWEEVINRLAFIGVEGRRLKRAEELKVRSCHFENVKLSANSFEGRQRVENFDMLEKEENIILPAGSFIILLNQPTARVIPHILEPRAPSSYFYWGFFNSIFEQKEYTESYVMESYARDMLKNEDLKKEFEKALEENPEMKDNQRAILNWFYMKSPYWDQRINRYPVFMIMDERLLDKLSF